MTILLLSTQILNSLQSWRFEKGFCVPFPEETVLNPTILRQTEADKEEKAPDGMIITIAPMNSEIVKPRMVNISGKLIGLTAPEVHRLCREIGKRAAFQEHKIIVDSLTSEVKGIEVAEINETAITQAIETVSKGTFSGSTILMSPILKAQLIKNRTLVPSWLVPKRENAHSFAGTISGCNAFWTTEIDNRVCLVTARSAVGIKRNTPQISLHPTGPNPTSIRFEEEMVCWAIDTGAVFVLKQKA